jgi:transposase-like protein
VDDPGISERIDSHCLLRETKEELSDLHLRLSRAGGRYPDRLSASVASRCWVHKMRNILEKVRRRDCDAVKADAQAIYGAESRRRAEAAFRRRWQPLYGSMVRQLERGLPELLAFFSFPQHPWRKLRTTNIIERASSRYGGAPGLWSAL